MTDDVKREALHDPGDLTLVLFNCGSTKKEDTRKECVKRVLGNLRDKPEPSVFLLVQDKISGPLHKLFSAENRVSKVPHNEKVGIYALPQPSNVSVEHIDSAVLTSTFTEMTPQGTDLIPSRTACCVIRQTNTTAKVLLVCWHGPHTKHSDKNKADCFDQLIDFVKHLCVENTCSAVMVGGDFNISDCVARELLDDRSDKNELQAEVISDYKQPAHRRGKDKIDFVVHWQAQCYELINKPSVIEPEWSVDDPFDHAIVMFRFREAKSATERVNESLRQLTERVDKLATQNKEMQMMIMQVSCRMEASQCQEMLKAKDEYIATLKQQIRNDARQHSDSLCSIRALTTGCKELVRAVLKEGRMPLLPPAERDWSRGVVTLPGVTRWPPKNWQQMTPDEKLDQVTTVATALQRLDGQETGTGGKVVIAYGMLLLPDTKYDERTHLTETQNKQFMILHKVAVSESVSAEETNIVLLMSQLPRPTGVVAQVIDALKDIPLKLL